MKLFKIIKKLNIRKKLLKFILVKILRYKNGNVFNIPQKILYFIFYPIQFIRYFHTNSKCNFNIISGFYCIDGLFFDMNLIDEFKKLKDEEYICISKLRP